MSAVLRAASADIHSTPSKTLLSGAARILRPRGRKSWQPHETPTRLLLYFLAGEQCYIWQGFCPERLPSGRFLGHSARTFYRPAASVWQNLSIELNHSSQKFLGLTNYLTICKPEMARAGGRFTPQSLHLQNFLTRAGWRPPSLKFWLLLISL